MNTASHCSRCRIILTSFSWTYALLQVPGGWLAERFGPRRTLFWANAMWSALTAATPLGFSLFSFIGLRALLGVGQAADWPSSIVAIRRWFPLRERGKGNSILLGGLYLGPIAAAPITTWVIASFGWRWAFYGYGSLGIVLGVAWWTFFRDRPEEHPNITRDEIAIIGHGEDRAAPLIPPGAFRRCLRETQFWAIGVQYFFLVMIQSFYGTWLPTYLVTARHQSLKAMGIYASLPWVAMFVSVFVTGALADLILRRTGSVWADTCAARHRRLRGQRHRADPGRAHAGRAADDGAAVRVAGVGGGDAGLHLAIHAGPGAGRNRTDRRLDQFLGQCRRCRGTDADGGVGELDRKLVGRADRHLAVRHRGRGAVAVRASAAAIGGVDVGALERVPQRRGR